MATGSSLTQNYSRSQSEVLRDFYTVTTWSRRLPKENEPSFKLCGLCMPNPAYTFWHIRLGNDMVRKT
ncbi:hypothetical protein TNCV_1200661 [Trichonephila clavipes]|nr:hypothetical protein TNCV_1200661 [Trichonephila clavipes]